MLACRLRRFVAEAARGVTPAYQELVGIGGDCWRCCIATILDLPKEEVPHFYADFVANADASNEKAEARTDAWLRERGLRLEHLTLPDVPFPECADAAPHVRYAMMCGLSPRCGTTDPMADDAYYHVVVVDLDAVRERDLRYIVHDPATSEPSQTPFATNAEGLLIWSDLIGIVPA
jgi:hypothetical protein